MPADARLRTVLITGASAGLGAALAQEYAAAGTVLGLLARRAGPLEAVAATCRERGAEVVTGVLDVTDAAALVSWIGDFDQRHPLDLVIVNAGLFDGISEDGALEDVNATQILLRTNLEAAVMTASTAAGCMRARSRGRIALVASLAARQPLADAPVYSASKAGLAAYGEALRERLAPEGIAVSIVLPGHIATAQTALQQGALPLLISAGEAARRIRRGLDRGRSVVAFPAGLSWLIRSGRCLPWRWRAWAGRSLRFTVTAPQRSSD